MGKSDDKTLWIKQNREQPKERGSDDRQVGDWWGDPKRKRGVGSKRSYWVSDKERPEQKQGMLGGRKIKETFISWPACLELQKEYGRNLCCKKNIHWHPDNHEDKEKRWSNLCTSCHSPLKMSPITSRKAERVKRWKEQNYRQQIQPTTCKEKQTKNSERERERGENSVFFLAFQSIFGFLNNLSMILN